MNNKEQSELTVQLNQETKTELDNEEIENAQPSRIVLFIFDAIENFEYKYYSIAGCLYIVMLTAIVTFLLTMKDKHFPNLPILQMFFVPTLLMFSLNFKLISNSNILPYITTKDLNWKVKKASISFIVSIVCLVAALTKCESSVVIFLYLSTWPLNILYEKFIKKQEIKYHLILPFIGVFLGCGLSTGALQLLGSDSINVELNGIIYALVGGIALTYCGNCLKSLKQENLFTIAHFTYNYLCSPFLPYLRSLISWIKRMVLFHYYCLNNARSLSYIHQSLCCRKLNFSIKLDQLGSSVLSRFQFAVQCQFAIFNLDDWFRNYSWMLFDDNIVSNDMELGRENNFIERKKLRKIGNDRIRKFRIKKDPVIMIYQMHNKININSLQLVYLRNLVQIFFIDNPIQIKHLFYNNQLKNSNSKLDQKHQ